MGGFFYCKMQIKQIDKVVEETEAALGFTPHIKFAEFQDTTQRKEAIRLATLLTQPLFDLLNKKIQKTLDAQCGEQNLGDMREVWRSIAC